MTQILRQYGHLLKYAPFRRIVIHSLTPYRQTAILHMRTTFQVNWTYSFYFIFIEDYCWFSQFFIVGLKENPLKKISHE